MRTIGNGILSTRDWYAHLGSRERALEIKGMLERMVIRLACRVCGHFTITKSYKCFGPKPLCANCAVG